MICIHRLSGRALFAEIKLHPCIYGRDHLGGREMLRREQLLCGETHEQAFARAALNAARSEAASLVRLLAHPGVTTTS